MDGYYIDCPLLSLSQEFASLHEDPFVPVGAGAWFFYILGMVMVVGGIMLLAPPSALASCLVCLKPKARPPMITQVLEVQRGGSPSPVSPAANAPDADEAPPPPKPLAREQTSSLELVGGMPGMGLMSFKFGAEAPAERSPNTMWAKLRGNLKGGVESARGAMESPGRRVTHGNGSTPPGSGPYNELTEPSGGASPAALGAAHSLAGSGPSTEELATAEAGEAGDGGAGGPLDKTASTMSAQRLSATNSLGVPSSRV